MRLGRLTSRPKLNHFASKTTSASDEHILTIENYASFNWQVREIEDGSLVVYTGGSPAAGVIELLSKVLAAVPAEVPFLHWGDVDAGSVRIFRFLEENLPRGPRPQMMTKELAKKSGRPADLDPSLASIARSDSEVNELADWLAFGIEPAISSRRLLIRDLRNGRRRHVSRIRLQRSWTRGNFCAVRGRRPPPVIPLSLCVRP